MFAINHLCFIICLLAVFTHGSNIEPVDGIVDKTNSENLTTLSRLPDTAAPWFYDLRITPDFKDSMFNGTAIIFVKVFKSAKEIQLHTKDLKIHSVELQNYKGDMKETITYTLDPENELMNITPSKSGLLEDNSYWRINITYSGKMNDDDMVGFYRSSYKVGNTVKWLAVTQFEPTFARMVFPCFDEPKFRAIFALTLYTEPQQIAISNMPTILKAVDGSKIRHVFALSRSMPTYLVAFMVSQMSSMSDSPKKKFNVWARENAIKNANHSLVVGSKCLQAMTKYTSAEYILPKMDLVALPDMSCDATENWGMITVRERNMLFDEPVSSEKNLQVVTRTIAHEIAHQWFGNYVSIYWWDDLWLIKGFAKYFEYKIIQMIQPAWRMDEFFVPDVLHRVLFEDGAYIHRPVSSPVQKPTEIANHFDIISYHKGASIMRMVESVVSSGIFQRAIGEYLNDRHIANGLAQPSDLWKAFDGFLRKNTVLPKGIDLSEVMKGWTSCAGYPLVTVSRMSPLSTNSLNDVITLQQEPYNAEYRSVSDQVLPKNQTWIIPISYTTKSSRNFASTSPTLWLVPGPSSIMIDQHLLSDEWIIVNIQQTGYYRVNYDLKSWNLLIQQLNDDPNVIHVLNRGQLMNDAWVLAMDNKLSFSVPFAMTGYLSRELDVLPWYSAIRKFEYVYSLYENTVIKELLRNFFLEYISYQYNELHAKKTDDHLTKVLRPLVISFAYRLGYNECVEHAELAFKENLSDLSKIPADMKSTAFCAALNNYSKFRGSDVWSRLWNLYTSSNSAHEKDALLYAVGCMKCRHHLKMYLGKLTNQSDHDIREQDYSIVYEAVCSTPNGVTAALQFIDDSARNITTMEPHVQRVILSILKIVKHKITTQDQVNILKKLNSEAESLKGKVCTKYAEAVRVAHELGFKNLEYIGARHGEILALLSKEKSGSPWAAPSTSMFTMLLLFVGWLVYVQA